MTSNSITIMDQTYREGITVVCINDHQMHDKINYLARYIVKSVEFNVRNAESGHSGYCLGITPIGKMEVVLVPVERFMTEDNFQRIHGAREEQETVKMGLEAQAAWEAAIKAFEYGQKDKADAGKYSTLVFDQDFVEAQNAVGAVFEYGCQKYSRKSFYNVPFDAWEKAEIRHKKHRYNGEVFDMESGLLHLAHQAANAIVMLQLYIKANPGIDYTKYNLPPQDHKNG